VDAPNMFDADVFDELRALLGDDGVLEVLESFNESMRERLRTVAAALAERDVPRIVREAHSTKSSAASLGFRRLSELARSLDFEGAGLSFDDLDARTRSIGVAFDEIQPVLEGLARRRA
jgi:HPt (histidine-containing phosphotransfer) domain-containing protein